MIVAGAGIGGSCAALWLSQTKQVTLLRGTSPVASAVAAGLANPFAGQRIRKFWNADQSYQDLLATLELASAQNTYTPTGILRPAISEAQASEFCERSVSDPNSVTWLSSGLMQKDYPSVRAPLGAAITTGGVVDTPQMLSAIFNTLPPNGTILSENLASWKDNGSNVTAVLASGTRLSAKTMILALGAGYTSFPELSCLNLHCIKGQVLQTSIPAGISVPLPVSGFGYIVPLRSRLILGTTYEHSYPNDKPTPEGMNKILALTRQMIPRVDSATIHRTSAGIRVGVSGTRLPIVGPITKNVWILTGLGSKGLLFGSYIGRNLSDWMVNPIRIPKELRIKNEILKKLTSEMSD